MRFPNLTGMPCGLEADLTYAEADFPTFDLAPRSKIPTSGSHGFHDATTDPETITARRLLNPEGNSAMATGKPSGVMVIDTDLERGGMESLAQLFAGHEDLDTFVVETGNGYHLYLEHDPTLESKKDFLPGLELKNDGHYVCVPPSVHPSGRPYTVLIDHDVAPCPEWLRDRLTALIQGKKPNGRTSEPIPERILKGARDSTLASLAGSLHHRGLPYVVTEATLQFVNQECCDPPLTEAQVEKIALSISRYELLQRGRQVIRLEPKGGNR